MKWLIAILLFGSSHPLLGERYAESWGGKQGQSIAINEKTILHTKTGNLQLFNPIVIAQDKVLSDVYLSVCLPLSFIPENPIDTQKIWIYQDITTCRRFVATFSHIPIGMGINASQMLHFRPHEIGSFKITYSIADDQYSVYTSYFTVIVDD